MRSDMQILGVGGWGGGDGGVAKDGTEADS